MSVLDGIQNLLAHGIPEGLQRGSSNLVDAYKKCELEGGTLGLYALSAIISDKAEPSEASSPRSSGPSASTPPPSCSAPSN